MLTMLTQKLRSQSLNEMQPYYPDEVLNEDDRDSGTESDDENLGATTDHEASGDPGETSDDTDVDAKTASFPPLRPVLVPSLQRPLQLVTQRASPAVKRPSSPASSPPSSPSLDRKCDSDFDRCSLGYETTSSVEFDPHSSEDELSVINCREKRTWSQRRGSCCSTGDSAGSSDEEVRDLLAADLQQTTGVAAEAPSRPLHFSSSPPRGVQHLNHRTVYACVQQRKRHRHVGSRDVSDATCIQRPCLDFDKMQVSACAPLICFY